MSEASGSRKTLAGWTMVDSKGEVMAMADDRSSESNESSTESFDLFQEDSIGASISTAASVELPQELDEELEDSGAPFVPSLVGGQSQNEISLPLLSFGMASESPEFISESAGIECIVSRQQSSDEAGVDSGHSTCETVESLVEKDAGFGACCEELMENTGYPKNLTDDHDYECNEMDMMEETDCSVPNSIPLDLNDSIPDPSFINADNRALRRRNNSDSDSDFVQINEDNLEEFEAELSNSRDNIPNRSPSIAEGFNFLGPAGDVREGNLSDRDVDFEEDFNEDTESSTEDVGDDRIESDQSEVGSVMNNNLSDVGDLSTFADIGDIPLEIGNVARNYRHRPNNRLSTALNVILIVVSLLTMGISIGLIMATDMELEEWENAYNRQLKKASSLEWTLADMQRSKNKLYAYESTLKTFSNANDPTRKFFASFDGIVNHFDACTKRHGNPSSVYCQDSALPDIQKSLSQFASDMKINDFSSPDYTFDKNVRKTTEKEPRFLPKEEQLYSADHYQNVQDLQQSLFREQERALHWQNLYLLERRQREWERENEDLEDQRDRAQWEKEDEEEDRRERERWEREEAENDRKERLIWEEEDQEQDRHEREKWEKERAEIDSLECLKKLMSTNLTFLRQHLTSWNVSGFDDFVNMSTLMSSIAEMKQSVLSSIEEMWVEAEQTMNKMGEDVKSGKQPYLDTSIMSNYLKQALKIFRSQFDDVVNVHSDNLNEKDKHDETDFTHRNKQKGKSTPRDHENVTGKPKKKNENVSGIWNKSIGKIFKKTSKSLRKFVRTMGSSWTAVKTLWKDKASRFMKTDKSAYKTPEELPSLLLPDWLLGETCQSIWLSDSSTKKESIYLDIASDCMWEVRDGFANLIVKESCNNHYGLDCNELTKTMWSLKKDFMKIVIAEASLKVIKVDKVNGRDIIGLFTEFWKKWKMSDLLLESDKKWVLCNLKEWTEDGPECDRYNNLKTLLAEINNQEIHHGGQKPFEEDIINGEDDYANERDVVVEHDVDADDDDTDNQENNKYSFSQYGSENEDYDYEDEEEEEEKDDKTYYKDVLKAVEIENNKNQNRDPGDSAPSKKHPPKTENERNISGWEHEPSGGDHYKQTAWYLKRAQYRLEMRRAQEKLNWFFDMSEHRDEMRKEHNVEKKSAQWHFDHAEDREAQRKKDQQADWLFERAHHRREESSKWSNHQQQQRRKYRKWKVVDKAKVNYGGDDVDNAIVRRKKMKELSESDWLLQNNGCKQNKVNGRGSGKEGCASRNTYKRNQQGNGKKGGKNRKPHHSSNTKHQGK